MKILLLGGGGFIGSHLAERLARSGAHEITCLDLSDAKLAALAGSENFFFVRANVCTPSGAATAQELIQNTDVVINLIAPPNPSLYVSKPLEVFRLTLLENFKIVELCSAYGKRLIQFSTSEVYGKTFPEAEAARFVGVAVPFKEDETDFIVGPVNKHRWIYSVSKQVLERAIDAYGLEGRLNYTIVRPFNFIGPRIDYLTTERTGTPRVFSCFMSALLTGSPMKLVNGGLSRRCYTYIDDAVDCLVLILTTPDKCSQQIFNIGNPANEADASDLALRMRHLYDLKYRRPDQPLSKIETVSGEDFYGLGYEDCDRRVPDILKAERLLGWTPKVDLTDALDRTMAYYVEKQ